MSDQNTRDEGYIADTQASCATKVRSITIEANRMETIRFIKVHNEKKNCPKRFSFDFDITMAKYFYFDYGNLVLVGTYTV